LNSANNFDLRLPNVVAYISNFSGMHASTWSNYGTQQPNGADNQDMTGWSLMGIRPGPLFASIAYEVHQDAGGAGSGLDRDALKIGAGFTMGAIMVGGGGDQSRRAHASEHDSFWLTGTSPWAATASPLLEVG
jgi:predicted porin